MKRVKPKQILWCVVGCLLSIFLILTYQGRRISTHFNEATLDASEPEPAYGKRFTFKALPEQPAVAPKLQSIGSLEGLAGRICYLTTQQNAKANKAAPMRTPILQIFQISDGKIIQVQNYELPAYDSASIGPMVSPLFRNQSKCFFHVMRAGTDVGEHQLYELDLKQKTGALREDRLFAGNRVLESPDANYYAFWTAEPWNEAYYRLIVVDELGKGKMLSEDLLSEIFSWTPDNTILYSAFPKNADYTKNYGYPNIYENELKGKLTLIKSGGYRPLMSPNRQHLAVFVPFIDPSKKEKNLEELRFGGRFAVRSVALAVYDRNTKKSKIVKRIYEQYPDLLWSKDGRFLYVVENFYTYSKQTTFCRLSVYDAVEDAFKSISRLEQKGQATNPEDTRLIPHFTPIKIANGKSLLLSVEVASTSKDAGISHLIKVDLNSGKREDLFTTSGLDTPFCDWLDD